MSAPRSEAAIVLLEAAQRCLQRHGVAGLSTRKVGPRRRYAERGT